MQSKTMLRSALVLLALSLIWLPATAQQSLSITIARIGGTVEVQHATETKGSWVKAKKDQVIGSGWNLRTAAESKAQLVFPQDNVVILKANSLLTVDKLDGTGAKVNAKSGGLLVDIKSALSPGSSFEVQTPTALAVVRGTKFGVDISSKPATQSATGGPLVAMNFMLGGKPLQVVQANPSFAVLLGGAEPYEGEVDGETVLIMPGVTVALLLPAIQKVRDAAARAADVNGDGKADIVISAGSVDASGQTREHILLAVGDLDGDGLEEYAFKDGAAGAEALLALLEGAEPDSAEGDGAVDVITSAGDGDPGRTGEEAAIDGEFKQDFQPVKPVRNQRVMFHGYSGVVEIVNELGASRMTAGTSVEADGASAPSDAEPSGDDAEDFLADAEDTELLDEFDAAAEAASANLAPIRAALLEEDRKLSEIENEWEGHVRRQDTGKLMLLFGELADMRERCDDHAEAIWRDLGDRGPLHDHAGMVRLMQEQGIPDTDLPPLLEDILARIAELVIDLEPHLAGQQELLDRMQGLLESDPRGSIRYDLLDSDNDGIPDGLELELGLDPMLSNRDSAIELIAPDDGEDYLFPPDAPIVFEFVGLDTDVPLTYNLVLEAGGQQALRRNVRETERMTLAQLVGPQGLLSGAIPPSGELNVNWHIEAQLRRPRSGPPVEIRSEQRSFRIQTPGTQAVEVSLRSAGTARMGSAVNIVGDISEVQALGAWEIEVEYDPAFLQFAQGSRTGLFAGSTVFFNDNGNGLLTISGQVPAGSAGLSGDGDIFNLSFAPQLPGQTEVLVGRVTLRDSVGGDINGRAGDSAEVDIARLGATAPSGPSGSPTQPGGAAVSPSSSTDIAGLPGLGPLLLKSPSNGSALSYPQDAEVEFEFDELGTRMDVVYNLILSQGAKSRKFSDYASGDPIQLSQLVGKGGSFADGLSGGELMLDWRIEADIDTGGAQPLRVSSESWQLRIGGPRNGTVSIDLGAMGQTSGLKPGDPVRVRGSISSVEGLGEFQIEVRFDAGVLEFDSGRRIGLFSSASVRVDNAGAGKVVISGSASGTGLSGDGGIFELTFMARNDGMAVIEPGQIRLSDILGGTIASSAGDEVEVEITSPSAGSGIPGGGGGQGNRNDPFAPR